MCRSFDAFDDHDLELARQEEDREGGEEGEREPLRVVEGGRGLVEAEEGARGPGTASARAQMSAMPPKRPQVTKPPTARKATSLTADSKAMAATMPSWRSARSRWRVPKAMAKAASARAT